MQQRRSRRSTRGFYSPRYWPAWLMLGYIRACAWLPLPVIVGIGSVVGTVLYWLARERRRVAGTNLRIAYPDADPAWIRRLNRACFRSAAIGMLEIGLAWWSPKRVRAMTEVSGLEYIERSRAQGGTGSMLLTAHFTCIEIGLPVLSAHVTLGAMYMRPHNLLLDRFMQRQRAKYAAVLTSNDLPLRLIRGLRRGYAMWYAPDQDFRDKDAVFAPLFGVEANSLTAPGRIARMANVPVMPTLIERKAWGRGYVLTILAPLSDFPTGEDHRDALVINRVTEDLIKRNPEQYLWVHRRYKRRPDGATSVYRP